MLLRQIAKMFGVDTSNGDAQVSNIEFDSRIISENGIFIALPETSQDSHNFIKDAENRGAIAAIVSKETHGISIPQIKVSNTLSALAEISMEYRKNYTGQIISLTGSTGKTTVKEMIASILQVGNSVLYSHKNYNNHIGVPYTMCKLNNSYKFCVLEMGANHLGELTSLTNMAKPDIAILNNISEAHIGEFGSMENIAKAKSEIFYGLLDHGTKVINYEAYDKITPHLNQINSKSSTLLFSRSKGDITAKDITLKDGGSTFTACTPAGKLHITLNLPGMHNIENALAAIAATYALSSQADIIDGLAKLVPIHGRLVTHQYTNNCKIIDDTYNAAPKAVMAAMEYLASLDGNKILVLGDLGELGKYENEVYVKIAEHAKSLSLNNVITCGKTSHTISSALSADALHFAGKDELITYLKNIQMIDTTILIKGARFMQMDKVVSALLKI